MMKIQDSLNEFILNTFRETAKMFLNRVHEKNHIVFQEQKQVGMARETAIIIQFLGDVDGRMVLMCSRKTAADFADTFGETGTEGNSQHEEMMRIKNTLGEMMNILGSKIALYLQPEYGIVRITTPTIIFGTDLSISIHNNCEHFYIDSTFGIFEITLSYG